MRSDSSFRRLSVGIVSLSAIVACSTAFLVTVPLLAGAQDITIPSRIAVPSSARAGEGVKIATAGSGKAIFYLLGPGTSRKTDVELGTEIALQPNELGRAGLYEAVVCSERCISTSFFVSPSTPAAMALLVHPSRVPVAQQNAISGVALSFDRFHNLASDSLPVKFDFVSGAKALLSRSNQTRDGVAWFRTDSSPSAGAFQVVASLADLSARRAVQQVASNPCNLRITGQRTATGVSLQTDPVHDCSGNPISDGTVVTFTVIGPDGKSTIDAPTKHGIASAKITTARTVVVSAASGIVLGNEIRLGGKP